jgi:hypothetical protein
VPPAVRHLGARLLCGGRRQVSQTAAGVCGGSITHDWVLRARRQCVPDLSMLPATHFEAPVLHVL